MVAFGDQLQVHYRAFLLDPEAPDNATERTVDVLARRYARSADDIAAMMDNVTQVAMTVGLTFDLDQTLSGSTRAAHRLVKVAQERDLQDKALERLFAAYFTEGRSLFDEASLAGLGGEIGLSVDDVTRAMTSNAIGQAVEDDIAEAVSLGATGVPFYVVGRTHGISGAQPPEHFVEVLTRAWESQ